MPGSTQAPLLRAIGLSKVHESGAERVVVLEGLALELRGGADLVVTGPSGSGKSTLLHALGGLDPPTSGEITLDGVDPYRLDAKALARFRNRKVGFVFQDHYLLPQCTVLENVLLPALAGGRIPPECAERARTLLARVSLEGKEDRFPSEISGGERQRVAVARAFLLSPPLLLCDEPTGNLDREAASLVADLTFGLHRETGGILIVVTHSLELAARFRSHAELRGGRLERVGKPEVSA
jgi:lipoprotein-releasing system ATP-binding protein